MNEKLIRRRPFLVHFLISTLLFNQLAMAGCYKPMAKLTVQFTRNKLLLPTTLAVALLHPYGTVSAGLITGDQLAPKAQPIIQLVDTNFDLRPAAFAGNFLHDPFAGNFLQAAPFRREITKIIDNFDQPIKNSKLLVTGVKGTNVTKAFPDLDVLGRERGVSLTVTSPKGRAESEVIIKDRLSEMKFTQETPSQSEMFIVWGAGQGPKHDFNLSENGGDRFLLRLKGNSPGDVVVKVYPVNGAGGNIYSTAKIHFDKSSLHADFEIPFSALVAGPNGGVNPFKEPVSVSLTVNQQPIAPVAQNKPVLPSAQHEAPVEQPSEKDAITKIDLFAVAGMKPGCAELPVCNPFAGGDVGGGGGGGLFGSSSGGVTGGFSPPLFTDIPHGGGFPPLFPFGPGGSGGSGSSGVSGDSGSSGVSGGSGSSGGPGPVVPEPPTIVLLMTGIGALAVGRKLLSRTP